MASKFSWGQPVCPDCWNGMKVKIGRPDKTINSVAFCCHCKRQIGRVETIYIQRVNPNSVPYPTVKKTAEEETA
jgi:hypothetical protein